MRTLCILLLLANVGYFAWEFNQELTARVARSTRSAARVSETGHLELLQELARLPPARDSLTEGKGSVAEGVSMNVEAQTPPSLPRSSPAPAGGSRPPPAILVSSPRPRVDPAGTATPAPAISATPTDETPSEPAQVLTASGTVPAADPSTAAPVPTMPSIGSPAAAPIPTPFPGSPTAAPTPTPSPAGSLPAVAMAPPSQVPAVNATRLVAPVPAAPASTGPGTSAARPVMQAAEPATVPDTATTAAATAASALPVPAATAAATAPIPSTCIKVGPLAARANAEALQSWFKERRSAVRLRTEESAERRLFWVYLEPMASADEAEAKLEDLKRRGVEDYRLIRSGDMKNAISLGVFSSQDSVNRRLAELGREGYRPLVVPRYETKKAYWLDVNLGPMLEFDESEFARLSPGSATIGRVPCSDMPDLERS